MTEMPPGYTLESKPSQISGEDCMGQIYSHWRQVAMTPHQTRKLIMMCGEGPQETTAKLVAECWRDHKFRELPAAQRLDGILAEAEKRGRFYDAELVDCLVAFRDLLSSH